MIKFIIIGIGVLLCLLDWFHIKFYEKNKIIELKKIDYDDFIIYEREEE